MTTMIQVSAIIFLTLLSLPARAQLSPPSPNEANLPVSHTGENIELPRMEVWGEKQELALRRVKSALERGRSHDYEDRNKLYCWYDTAPGSHMLHLYCARNRTLNHIARQFMAHNGVMGGAMRASRYLRDIWVSPFPINPIALEKKFAGLGPSAVNHEIVARVRGGEELPENVPSEAEINRFAAALKEIKALRAHAAADSTALDAQLAAIVDEHGLTVDRYNHISKLVEHYDSLRKMVQDRL